ncbi:hypothetical protein HaLaN_24780, partial [Haematococcus lacustris]
MSASGGQTMADPKDGIRRTCWAMVGLDCEGGLAHAGMFKQVQCTDIASANVQCHRGVFFPKMCFDNLSAYSMRNEAG